MIFTWEETEHKIDQQDNNLRFGTNTSLGGMRFYPSLVNFIRPTLSFRLP
jgi:hypothetical protein